MEPDQVLQILDTKIEEIKREHVSFCNYCNGTGIRKDKQCTRCNGNGFQIGLPEDGRRLIIKAYYLPPEFWNALMKIKEFKELSKKGKQNLGGIPVYPSPELKIVWEQQKKQHKFFRKERRRMEFVRD